MVICKCKEILQRFWRYGFIIEVLLDSLILPRLYPHFVPSLILLMILCGATRSTAQDTMATVVKDATNLIGKHSFHLLPAEHSPKVAGIASAIIPGLGQAYNKKYWKIPIVYAGIATAGYFIYYNYTIYSNFKKAYESRIDLDSTSSLESFDVWYITSTQPVYLAGFETSGLQTVQNSYRGYLDLSVIVAAGVYALNIVDAVVDAHLYDFDVGDDLSLNIRPFLTPGIHGKGSQGITLTLNF
jgi:hypothetical protein